MKKLNKIKIINLLQRQTPVKQISEKIGVSRQYVYEIKKFYQKKQYYIEHAGSTKVCHINMSRKVRNILIKLNIKDLKKLSNFRYFYLRSVWGFGNKSLKELVELVNKHGIKLKYDRDDNATPAWVYYRKSHQVKMLADRLEWINKAIDSIEDWCEETHSNAKICYPIFFKRKVNILFAMDRLAEAEAHMKSMMKFFPDTLHYKRFYRQIKNKLVKQGRF